jgi:WD40 repeat protein
VRQASFSPDGKTMLIRRDTSVHLIRDSGEPIVSLGAGRSSFVAAAFSPSSRFVAAETADGTVRIVRGGVVVKRLEVEPGPGLAFAGNDLLLTIGRGNVQVWGVPDGRLLRTLRAGGDVTAVAAGNDGSIAATLSDRRVRLWRPQDGGSPSSLAADADAVGVSPDGSRLVTIEGDRAVIWDVASRRRLYVLAGHTRPILDFAFSANGDLLVTGARDHDARVWSMRDGRRISLLRGHFSPVYGVSASADGRWVVTASQLAAGLWRSSSGQLLFYLRGAKGPLTGISFSADGHSILTGSLDGSAYLYRCDVCGNLASLEALATKRLASAPASAG